METPIQIPPDFTFTLENLAALNQAIATGAREVQYGDKRIAYMPLEQMLRIRNIMMQDLGIKGQTTRKYPTFSKGIC